MDLKIKQNFGANQFLEIYYIPKDGIPFMFEITIDSETGKKIPVNPEIKRFNWALKNKIKIQSLICDLQRNRSNMMKSVIGIYEEGHIIKTFPNVNTNFKPPIYIDDFTN